MAKYSYIVDYVEQRSKRNRAMKARGRKKGYEEYMERKKGDRRRVKAKPDAVVEEVCEVFREEEPGDIGWIGDRGWNCGDPDLGGESYTESHAAAGREKVRIEYGPSDSDRDREDRLEAILAGGGDGSYFSRLHRAEQQRKSSTECGVGCRLFSGGEISE